MDKKLKKRIFSLKIYERKTKNIVISYAVKYNVIITTAKG